MDAVIYISVCLSNGSIRLFKETVRSLDTPKYVRFYINIEKSLLAVAPYHKNSLKSHKIPKNLYTNNGAMVIYSKMFCEILYRQMNWNRDMLYRVPGKTLPEENIAVFDLMKAKAYNDCDF